MKHTTLYDNFINMSRLNSSWELCTEYLLRKNDKPPIISMECWKIGLNHISQPTDYIRGIKNTIRQ